MSVPRIAAPLVSVIVTCYNYARYLSDAVDSVLNQTFREFEIIVVNDGSTDNSLEIARRLIADNPGYSISIIDQPNSGHPALSRNAGIKASRGRYILPLDADDKLHPDMLKKCLDVFDTHTDVSIVYTDRLDFDGVDEVVSAAEYDFKKLRYGNQLSYCALYKREVWEDAGGYLPVGYEDWDFWISAGAAGHKALHISQPLFLYRRHDTGRFQTDKNVHDLLAAEMVIRHQEIYRYKDIVQARNMILAERGNNGAVFLAANRLKKFGLFRFLLLKARYRFITVPAQRRKLPV